MRAPWDRGINMPHVNSKAWCRGSTLSSRSLVFSGNSVAMLASMAQKLPWVSMTPLGSPVVPDV